MWFIFRKITDKKKKKKIDNNSRVKAEQEPWQHPLCFWATMPVYVSAEEQCPPRPKLQFRKLGSSPVSSAASKSPTTCRLSSPIPSTLLPSLAFTPLLLVNLSTSCFQCFSDNTFCLVKSKIGVLGSGGNFLVYSLFCPMRKLVKLASGSKFDKMKLNQLFPLFDLEIVRIWVEN